MNPSPRDVRMRGFRDRAEVSALLRLIEERVAPLGPEAVDLFNAAGRVLAAPVVAPCDVPQFDRAAMDGYALRGSETFGAENYAPIELTVVGDAYPARAYAGVLEPGQAARIMTGAPLPRGADAVAPAEAAAETTALGTRRVRITEPVPPGRHVGRRGEDIERGNPLLPAGRVLRPQDVGLLASVGAAPVRVLRQPSVAVLVTGDELLPAGAKPEGYRIVDSNSVMLDALARRDGAGAVRVQMVPDGHANVRQAVEAVEEDLVLISGGSSVGLEDHAPRVVAELGELLVHGVALRPASPTGFGVVRGKPVFLVPGNPVSCLCAYDLFIGPALRRLGGRPVGGPYRQVQRVLARKIASALGRVDYVRVQIRDERVEPLAISGASLLSSTTRADGYVLVPGELEGYAEGATVYVFLYDIVA